MLQKYRVFCPHCSASLLVTEDLMGAPADCPGCREAFLLPTVEELTIETSQEPPPVPAPAAIPTMPDSFETAPAAAPNVSGVTHLQPPAAGKRHLKPVRIERRAELRFFSSLLKVVALVQVLVSFAMLVTTIVGSIQSHPGTPAVLMSIGTSMLIGIGSVPTYAFAELILVFTAQEEMLRHILNELRNRE